MKDVLISTQPKWVAKICNEIYKRADGTPVYEKEIEVRKTRPKQEVPFRCFIYETKGKKVECGFHFEETGRTLRDKYIFGCKEAKIVKHYRNEGSGKVIGEFICDRIEDLMFETEKEAFEQLKRQKNSLEEMYADKDFIDEVLVELGGAR